MGTCFSGARVRGCVVAGRRRGRSLGFPTINVETVDSMEPGVYAGRVVIEGQSHGAAINVGAAPTFADERFIVEAYLIDWSGQAYGKEVALEIEAFLRPTRDFGDAESLARQIALDVEAARKALGEARH